MWVAACAAFAQAPEPRKGGGSEATGAIAAIRPEPSPRTIALRHHWTREQLKVVYRIGDVYQPEAMAEINDFLRDRRCGKTIEMDPRLIDLIYELHQELGGRGAVRVVSAYRSEGYNASLLRAGRMVDPNSQHMQGHAADIFFPGVPVDQVREAAIKRGAGGVGRYAFSWPAFVHVDTGPVRHWDEPDPREHKTGAIPARGRFHLDCALRMADVFEKIPEEQAIAALPPGASVKSPESVQNAAFSGSQPLLVHGASKTGIAVPGADAVPGAGGGSCMAADPLKPLALLPKP